LKNQREQLSARIKEMQKTLDLLDYKISIYEDAILKKAKELVQTVTL